MEDDGAGSEEAIHGVGLACSATRRDHAVLALWLLALLAAVGWGQFASWYSLPANENNTHFAFEKIPGGFASPIMRGTLVLFLVLGAIYAGGYFLIARQQRLSQGAKIAIVLLSVCQRSPISSSIPLARSTFSTT